MKITREYLTQTVVEKSRGAICGEYGISYWRPYTEGEAAQSTKLSERTLRRWRIAGHIPYLQSDIGEHLRYPGWVLADIIQFGQDAGKIAKLFPPTDGDEDGMAVA